MALPPTDNLSISAMKSVGGAASERVELIMPRSSTIQDLVASLAERESTPLANIIVMRRGVLLRELSDALIKFEVDGRVDIVYIDRGHLAGAKRARPRSDTLNVFARKSVGGAVGAPVELNMSRSSTVRDLVASLSERESTDLAHITLTCRGVLLHELSDALMKCEVDGRVDIVYVIRGNLAGTDKAAAIAGPHSALQLEKPSEAYKELFVTHVLESHYKHLHLLDIIRDLPPWSISLGGAAKDPLPRLSFGPTVSFEVQFLGSESYDSCSWLQARCNPSQGLHPGLIDASTALGDLGIFEFATDRLEQRDVPLWQGNWMAMVACGVLGSKAYYSGPTGPFGAAFFLITDDGFPGRVPELQYDAARILRTIGEGLDLFAKFAKLAPADVWRCVRAFIAARGGVMDICNGDSDEIRTHVIQAIGEDVAFIKTAPDGRILEMGTALRPNLQNPAHA